MSSLSPSAASAASMRSPSSVSSPPPTSTRSAADSGGSSCHSLGVPGMMWLAAINAGATMSSTARHPASTSAGTGSTAASIEGKCSHAMAVRAGCGRVRNTASATNASVPSEPTTSRRRISSGESASRNAHRR